MKKYLVGSAIAVSALLGALIAAPAQAAEITPQSACSAGWYYHPSSRGADSFGAAGSTLSGYNGTSSNATVTFTSQTSGTVSASYTGSTNVGLSAEIASISSTYSITAGVSKTVTTGVSIAITVPAKKTGYGQYGAYKAYVDGYEYYSNAACTTTKTASKKIYSPYRVGWNTWVG